ncbi:MAG: hypothetical protein IIA10_09065 [Proteobacteria bacterium]|nr:hypothetical protein [Pseudomonadota bacterium]MCH7833922.1 hypothetical protein [Pseudomonadota bacterium]
MNKKFLISWLVVFVASMAGGFVVHVVLLGAGYAELPNLFRSDAESQQYFHLMLLAHIIMAGALVWIYQRGQENKPWLQQGARFGIAVALLGPVPLYIIYYVVQPMPGSHVVQQMVYDGALMVLLGILTAFMNRAPEQPAQSAET